MPSVLCVIKQKKLWKSLGFKKEQAWVWSNFSFVMIQHVKWIY